jgi:hypothetical protein
MAFFDFAIAACLCPTIEPYSVWRSSRIGLACARIAPTVLRRGG